MVKDVAQKTATAGKREFLTSGREAASAGATETEPFVGPLVWLQGPFVPAATADLGRAYGGLSETGLSLRGLPAQRPI